MMRLGVVTGKADELAAELTGLSCQLVASAKLCGAHGREVMGMSEEDGPWLVCLTGQPGVQPKVSLRGLYWEVGDGGADSQRIWPHRRRRGVRGRGRLHHFLRELQTLHGAHVLLARGKLLNVEILELGLGIRGRHWGADNELFTVLPVSGGRETIAGSQLQRGQDALDLLEIATSRCRIQDGEFHRCAVQDDQGPGRQRNALSRHLRGVQHAKCIHDLAVGIRNDRELKGVSNKLRIRQDVLLPFVVRCHGVARQPDQLAAHAPEVSPERLALA
mmetsp:Transcript_117652/g.344541  ORF Transcript_117652/g.344541 Transcript_117652/m.344541 type:complete len:275 (+) Transcript_117652:633-1457(+)